MEFNGYMIKVYWDGSVLSVRGLTKGARIGLLGADHERGEVVLRREQIASASYRRPGLFVNGRVVIRDVGGRKYILHFLRKHREPFARLARDLGAVGV